MEQIGKDVALHVIDGNERFIQRPRRRFGCRDADQKRADKSRPLGDGNGIRLLPGNPRVCQRLFRDGQHVLDVVARRNLRHDAAEFLMHGDLRRNDIG